MSSTLQAETLGPVDVVVILFDGNRFNGDVAPALAEANDSGAVRILDLAFVSRDREGSVSIIEAADLDLATPLSGSGGSQFDLLSEEDLQEMGSGLDPGSSALAVVWENTWAAGGRPRARGGRPPRPGARSSPSSGSPARTCSGPCSHWKTSRGRGAMPRRRGRPGLMGTVARTTVIAGTATAVSGGVQRRAAATQQAAAAQQQDAAAQQQAAIDQAASQAAAQTAAQLSATPPAPSVDDKVAKIKALGELRTQGLLTDDEFAAEKAKVLAD
jgi:hypothetical protein